MSTDEVGGDNPIEGTGAANFDMKLEVVVIPVSDVDRAKEFYTKLGWRRDADRVSGSGFRLIQFSGQFRRSRMDSGCCAVSNSQNRVRCSLPPDWIHAL